MIIKIKKVLMVLLALPIIVLGVTNGNNVAEAYTTQDTLGTIQIERSISTSTTGKYVAFLSSNSTLVSPDLNSRSDAFIKDTDTGTISLLSITPSGNSGNGHTRDKVMLSGNGRFALFNSEASDLATTPGGYAKSNLYLRDLYGATTYLIAAGVYGSGVDNYPIGLSEDGRFIYYTSNQNGVPYLYVKDRTLGTTGRLDVDSTGNPGNAGFLNSGNQRQVSCDGRFVVFSSASSNLVSGDTNGVNDVFLVDRMGGHIIKNLTINSNGTNWTPSITCDGNYVIFGSDASNLVSSDANGVTDIFKYSISNESVDRVSLKDDESEYSSSSTNSAISMDGRYVFYIQMPSSGNYLTMRDTKLGTTSVIAPSGSNYFAWNPIVTHDGSKVFYISTASKTVNVNQYLHLVTGHLPI